MVQLGEQSHGDGSCFDCKIRLIKFLHEEMGFNTLAIESGIYDCHVAAKAFEQGEDPLTAARLGVFGIWTGSRQTGPLWDYISEQAKTPTPLHLAGFDCQFTAEGSRQSLAQDLVTIAKQTGLGFTDTQLVDFERALQQAVSQQVTESTLPAIEAVLVPLGDELRKTGTSMPEADRSFWSQVIESSLEHLRTNLRDSSPNRQQLNRRDAQMARNLLWLSRGNRKIIVWAASFHITRELQDIRTLQELHYVDTKPMGQHIAQELGLAAYTIGFTAFEGSAGSWFQPPHSIEPAIAGTFESLCNEAGLENAVIPLRGIPQDSWLQAPIYARPLGYAWMEAVWPKHFDAMIYQRKMTPSAPR